MMAITFQQAAPGASRMKGREIDHVVQWVAVAALLTAVIAFFYFQNASLAYKDAVSHLDIARRVIDSPTRGLAQLGGVWLPLPHLLAVPLIGIDLFYYTGFAGTVFSMLAYVATSILLYKIARSLTGRSLGGVVAAVIFMFNPNVLYMQSTPMTELMLFACMAGLVYGVQRWVVTDRNVYLIGGAVAGLLGTLTRYEAWVLLGVMVIVVAFIAVRKRFPYTQIEGTVLAFVLIGCIGVALWGLWNMLLFGNPLYFQVGDYAKPSLWVGDGEAAVGNWWVALLTYSYAVLENLWWVTIVLAVAGLAVLIAKEKLSDRVLPVMSLLAIFPFFVVALEQGQRPLHVMQITGDLYNVRFGLLMVLPAAVLASYLTVLLPRRRYLDYGIAAVLCATVVLSMLGGMIDRDGIVVLREPTVASQKTYTATTLEVSSYLAQHHNGGDILMESFGNDMIMFNAKIPLHYNIHEGSYRLWEPALQDPAGHNIQWIVMRHAGNNQSDKVFGALYGTGALEPYRLVLQNDSYYIYERRPQ